MRLHRACSFIVAIAVLHTIDILRNEPIVEDAKEVVLQEIQPQVEQYEGQQEECRIREYFANFFFIKSTQSMQIRVKSGIHTYYNNNSMAVNIYMAVNNGRQYIHGSQYIHVFVFLLSLIKKTYCRFPFLQIFIPPTKIGTVVIVWWLGLQRNMQSVPITTNIVSSNPVQARGTRCNILR